LGENLDIFVGDVDIVDGTGKGNLAVELHSKDSPEHLIENVCTTLCNVVCLFFILSKYVVTNMCSETKAMIGVRP
jgi:hypothetical protein